MITLIASLWMSLFSPVPKVAQVQTCVWPHTCSAIAQVQTCQMPNKCSING